LETAVLLAAPLLLTALIIGVLVGLFQAAIQINEMTLSFVPKLVVMVIVLLLGGSWMLSLLTDFTTQLFHDIPQLIG
jgi:flagellar biosynthetic protein FliQ